MAKSLKFVKTFLLENLALLGARYVLVIAVILCVVFISVEVVGGIKANSPAILTDAAHLLSDVAAFAISLFSLWAAGWEATPRQSYGFCRIEILGALVSILLIWLLAGILVYEAIARLINGTEEVNGFLMFLVAAFGLVVNIVMAVLLGHDHSHGHGHGHDHHHEHDDGHTHRIGVTTHSFHSHHHEEKLKHDEHDNHHDHNDGHHHHEDHINPPLKHSDIENKSEVAEEATECQHTRTTIKLLRNILEVLMESTPREIDATRLEQGLCGVEDVVAVHELHIWAITVGKILLACHVKIRPEANADVVLDNVIEYIRREYNISHGVRLGWGTRITFVPPVVS
ncbi:Cation efflux protein [Dillenia turbinata]|uniref:Cation efflux protein n=1 Tax=Dillenia turbinata TaxID=194707 RepID=A0AAN8UX07_9MAGN